MRRNAFGDCTLRVHISMKSDSFAICDFLDAQGGEPAQARGRGAGGGARNPRMPVLPVEYRYQGDALSLLHFTA
jgi:hypothetical protein